MRKCLLFVVLLTLIEYGFTNEQKTGCTCSKVAPERHLEWEQKNSRKKRETGSCSGKKDSDDTQNDYMDEGDAKVAEDAEDAEYDDYNDAYDYNSTNYQDYSGADDRIVGGYDAVKNKPWIAKIWLVQTKFLCGASILNKRYLITAGHCVCNSQLKCSKSGKILYTPKTTIVAYLGINNMKVEIDNESIKGNKRYEYGVEKTIIFPGYMLTMRHQDIGLVKLDRDINFMPGVLEPICLPAADDKSDTVNGEKVLSVYVAGWGRMFHVCSTNEHGPVKNIKCQLPFSYRGQQMFQCSKSTNPDAKLEECQNFRSAMPNQYPSREGDSVIIMSGNKNTTCNYIKSGEHGWCKAVDQDDNFDDNWGWCAEHCQYKEGVQSTIDKQLATKLQEANLQVLPMAHCKYHVTKGKYEFRGLKELCAGRKKRFKTINVFQKSGNSYTMKGTQTDFLGLDKDGKYPYNYYISGTDSCNGDSGGPLYTWKNGVPVLIGIVARGYGSADRDGCAELNFPGIYTRTAKFLDWIHTNIADGNCK